MIVIEYMENGSLDAFLRVSIIVTTQFALGFQHTILNWLLSCS